jgi:hypothetical protein
VSTSSSFERRRKLGRIDGRRVCFSHFGATFGSQCFASPCQAPQIPYDEWVKELAPKAMTTVSGASSLHTQAHRVSHFICDIADAVFRRSGRHATSGVSPASDGQWVSFGAPTRGPRRDGVSVMAADNAFTAAVSARAMRGYDAAQKEGLAPGAQFDPTTVMNKTWAPERPQAGGNTGHEP